MPELWHHAVIYEEFAILWKYFEREWLASMTWEGAYK